MQSNQCTTSPTTDAIISSSGLVYVSGQFPYLFVLDSTTLAETDRIPSDASHCRLSLLDNPNDDESRWIAASQGAHSPSDRVLIYDVKTKECVNQLIGASHFGLETISNSSLSSNSVVLSGGYEKILVFDSITSDVLCELPNPPNQTYRISHFPKWNRNQVFVGGSLGHLSQYDLNQEEEYVQMGMYGGHRSYVHGLSFSLSHQLLISGSSDKTLKFWNFSQFGNSCVNSIQLDKSCFSVKYLEDLHLICCGNYSEIEIFDIRNLSQRIKKVSNTGFGYVYDLDRIDSSSSSDPLCVSGSIGGVVSIWNPISGAVLQKQRCGGSVYGVRFLGDLSPAVVTPSSSAVHVESSLTSSIPNAEDSNCPVVDEQDLMDDGEVAPSTSLDAPGPVPPSGPSLASAQSPPFDDDDSPTDGDHPDHLPDLPSIPSTLTANATSTHPTLNLLLDPSSVTISREVLGSGSFGRVMKGTLSILSNQGLQRTIRYPVAIKTIRCSENENEITKEKVLREVRIMAEVNHENCLQCFGCWFSEDRVDHSERAHVVLELCEKDGIFEWMKRQKANGFFLENGRVRLEILLQITSGMIHLHSIGIVHRDIKPKNLLVDSNGIVKVADYGLSKHVGSVGSTMCGSSIYIDDPRATTRVGTDPKKKDVYSFSLLAYELWYCTLAFEELRQRFSRDVVALLTEIRENDLRPVIEPGTMPSALRDLLERGWDNNPEVRPSFEEIHSVLTSLLSSIPGVVRAALGPVPEPSNSFSFLDRSETVQQQANEETVLGLLQTPPSPFESLLEENRFGDLFPMLGELGIATIDELKDVMEVEEIREGVLGELFDASSVRGMVRRRLFLRWVESI